MTIHIMCFGPALTILALWYDPVRLYKKTSCAENDLLSDARHSGCSYQGSSKYELTIDYIAHRARGG